MYPKSTILLFILSTLFSGCGQGNHGVGQRDSNASESVPYVTSADLQRKLSTDNGLVLVEFCVPAGCHRCDQMRGQVDTLAENKKDRANVCRVNLTSERSYALQNGINMCPTYVAYVDGREVFRAAYPTSGDMLAVELDRLTELETTPSEVSQQTKIE